MRLFTNGKVFAVQCTFDEKTLPKLAGFWWHRGNCRPGCEACASKLSKVWWTPHVDTAFRLKQYVLPEDKALFEPLFGAKAKALEESALTDSDIEIPVPAGLAYLPYQKAGIAYAAKRTNVLIADEMGLGKTIQALGVINFHTDIRRVLVVCPSSVKLNWVREAQKWLTRDFGCSTFESHEDFVVPPDSLVVVSYDKCKQVLSHDALMAQDWDLLICDEAHYIKTAKSQRTIAILGQKNKQGKGLDSTDFKSGLTHRAKRRIFLTGTPILNRPLELQCIVASLDAQFDGFSYLKRYCDAKQTIKGGRSVWDFSGSSNLPELQQRLRSSIMIRRLKKDVLTELPAKQRQVVVFPASGKLGKAVDAENALHESHESVLEEIKTELIWAHATQDKDTYDKTLKILTENRSAGTALIQARQETALAKVPMVLEHLVNVLESTEGKIVVFGHHVEVLAQICNGLIDAGYPPVVITGATSAKNRQKAVDEFQNNPNVRVFLGNIHAAGIGITLTASSTVIFAELDWVPANLSQAEDRCHRIGQKDSVLVQHLVLENSLDMRMARVLIEKQGIADLALDIDPELSIQEEARKVAATTAEKRPKAYPSASALQKVAAKDAMQSLARVCDGASALDGAGFSKIDTDIGKKLARYEPVYSDGQVWLAKKLATRYQRQLDDGILNILGIERKR